MSGTLEKWLRPTAHAAEESKTPSHSSTRSSSPHFPLSRTTSAMRGIGSGNTDNSVSADASQCLTIAASGTARVTSAQQTTNVRGRQATLDGHLLGTNLRGPTRESRAQRRRRWPWAVGGGRVPLRSHLAPREAAFDYEMARMRPTTCEGPICGCPRRRDILDNTLVSTWAREDWCRHIIRDMAFSHAQRGGPSTPALLAVAWGSTVSVANIDRTRSLARLHRRGECGLQIGAANDWDSNLGPQSNLGGGLLRASGAGQDPGGAVECGFEAAVTFEAPRAAKATHIEWSPIHSERFIALYRRSNGAQICNVLRPDVPPSERPYLGVNGAGRGHGGGIAAASGESGSGAGVVLSDIKCPARCRIAVASASDADLRVWDLRDISAPSIRIPAKGFYHRMREESPIHVSDDGRIVAVANKSECSILLWDIRACRSPLLHMRQESTTGDIVGLSGCGRAVNLVATHRNGVSAIDVPSKRFLYRSTARTWSTYGASGGLSAALQRRLPPAKGCWDSVRGVFYIGNSEHDGVHVLNPAREGVLTTIGCSQLGSGMSCAAPVVACAIDAVDGRLAVATALNDIVTIGCSGGHEASIRQRTGTVTKCSSRGGDEGSSLTDLRPTREDRAAR